MNISRRLRIGVAASVAVVSAGCVHPPSVSGVSGTSPAPNAAWTPPERPVAATSAAGAVPQIPADIESRLKQLTLTDIVDLALRNNPATRISWANARAAAAVYGSSKGAWFPTIDADVNGSRFKTVATQGRSAVQQTTYGPSLTLSYLLLDFGGRSGNVAVAKQALLSADWTHNATIQDVVLQVESAYFNYMATKGLLEAQQSTLKDAQTNYQAAQERHRVGVATIADVLQAQTALSQAQLDAESTEGTLQTTRGALALALGLPANVPYDVEQPAHIPVATLADSVDTLIARAVSLRPDLAAAMADSASAHAHIGAVRAERLPSLLLSGNGGRTYIQNRGSGNNYTISLGLSIPLFAGFSRAYNQMQAEAQAQAAASRLDALRQQVMFQVFSSYYTLQTATRRVKTADDLLASAQLSDSVALGRYKAGVGSVLDLLAAQSALANARAQQVQSRWIWQTALAQLAHDAGVLDAHGNSNVHLAPDSTGRE